ncbi:MAG: glycosyltransferase family 2 protein [Gammaproteobacteria bacterium]|nr:glycosyltransferase family 2 protein [Gammaproteobacteria bacterium]
MEVQPTISVVMPVYNEERYLESAVQSILDQTFGDFELIVVDDCSGDTTQAQLERLAAGDPRVRIQRNPRNMGATASINRGLDQARGEFIARMDADDIALPERLDAQVRVMRERPEVVLCGAATIRVDSNGNRLALGEWPVDPVVLAWYGIFRPVVAHPTAMYRRSLIDRGLRYDEDLHTAQDFGFWSKLVEHGSVAMIATPLLLYREHSGSVSATKRQQQRQDAAQVCASNLENRFAEFCSWRSDVDPVSVARFVHGSAAFDAAGAQAAVRSLLLLEQVYLDSCGEVSDAERKAIQRITARWILQALAMQSGLKFFEKMLILRSLVGRTHRMIEEVGRYVGRRMRVSRFR